MFYCRVRRKLLSSVQVPIFTFWEHLNVGAVSNVTLSSQEEITLQLPIFSPAPPPLGDAHNTMPRTTAHNTMHNTMHTTQCHNHTTVLYYNTIQCQTKLCHSTPCHTKPYHSTPCYRTLHHIMVPSDKGKHIKPVCTFGIFTICFQSEGRWGIRSIYSPTFAEHSHS